MWKWVTYYYIEAVNLTRSHFRIPMRPIYTISVGRSVSASSRCVKQRIVMDDAHWFFCFCFCFLFAFVCLHTFYAHSKCNALVSIRAYAKCIIINLLWFRSVSHHQVFALISIYSVVLSVAVRAWVGRMQWSNGGWPMVMLNAANRFALAGWLYKYCRWSCWSRCTAIAFFIRIFITSKSYF